MKWFWLALIAAAVAYAATGVYTVAPDERALVRRFGRVVEVQSEPGLHFGLPWGLDRVDRVKPSETKAVTIGAAAPADRVLSAMPTDAAAQFLTGDQNLVNVQATVQYTIRTTPDGAKSYLFGSADPMKVISRAAESALSATLADQSIDVVLTTGKSVLADHVRDRLQEQLDGYGFGVEVRSVSLIELAPPPNVAEAFTRAASARSDRERLILESRTYANARIATATSEARESLDRATAERDRGVDLARSQADRFKKLLYEYQKAPELTATRLYLETMAEILPKFRSKVVIDKGQGVDVTIMRGEP